MQDASRIYKDLMDIKAVCNRRKNVIKDEIESEMFADWESILLDTLKLLDERKYILEQIDTMIDEWSKVKTWAGVCKRNALRDLQTKIIRKRIKDEHT